ncbi:hypothetical protein [Collimonas sp. OK242]|uniref:hypothetical protein n=1 Tax=Collimonas sp. OK242 TaxID=1798195 RepID=UPI00115FF2D9|nr:hypothetical protein [Collimonas sp. OK242]
MNLCPHCKSESCLPLWRKLCLGPAGTACCRICGCKVGVDVSRSCLAMLPTLLLVIMASFGLVRDPVTLAASLLLCLVCTFALYAAWVPLRPEELTSANMVAIGRARIAAAKQAARRPGKGKGK